VRYRRLATRYATVVTIRGYVPGADLLRTLPAGFGRIRYGWRPAADVRESADRVDVLIDLAGVDEDDVDIQLFEDALIVEGLRRLPGAGEGMYHAAEIRQGPFRLEVPLPARADLDRVEATYQRGLLVISLPKPGATTRPRGPDDARVISPSLGGDASVRGNGRGDGSG
jgi:HSP20 family molecular chaperone IbpA